MDITNQRRARRKVTANNRNKNTRHQQLDMSSDDEKELPEHFADDAADDGQQEAGSGASDAKHEVLVTLPCSLFRFNKAAGQWVGRGKGHLRLLRSLQTGFIRILLRDDKTLLLRLNHYIIPSQELQPNPGSDRSWTWTSRDYTEADDGGIHYTFASRFASVADAHTFKEAYDLARLDHQEAVATWKAHQQQLEPQRLQDVEIGERGQALASVFQSLSVDGEFPQLQSFGDEHLLARVHPAAFGQQQQHQEQEVYDPARQHPASLVPPVEPLRQLWGGAVHCRLEPRFVDVSQFRTIPDYQEVYADADTDQSVVFELLQLHSCPADRLAVTCFEDLIRANQAVDASVESIRSHPLKAAMPSLYEALPDKALADSLEVQMLHGQQVVGKYRDQGRDKGNLVHLGLAAVRLAHLGTDLLVSFNFPASFSVQSSVGKGGLAELQEAAARVSPETVDAAMDRVLGSFKVLDWGLFRPAEQQEQQPSSGDSAAVVPAEDEVKDAEEPPEQETTSAEERKQADGDNQQNHDYAPATPSSLNLT